MANTFINATTIAREFLRVLHSNCPFISTVDRQWDGTKEFGGVKNAGNITIRKPAKYAVRSGATIDVQDHENTSTSLAIDQQSGVDIQFTSKDMTLKLDDFSQQFIQPAAARLAAKLEAYALNQAYKAVWSSVGTAGTTPNSAKVWLEGGAALDKNLAPRDGMRYGLMSPDAQAETVDALKGLFHSGSDISKQYKDGQMGDVLGLKFNMGQLTPTHTTGEFDGTVLVDGTISTEGTTTLHIDGLTTAAGVINQGDVFTVGSVYAVDEDGNSTSDLYQFVVSEAATAVSNEVDVEVQAMYTTGKNKNINAFPQDGAAITFIGSELTPYKQNMVYHKDFYTFATVDLETPRGVDFSAREVMDGISLRVIRDYDINNDLFPCRIDVLYNGVTQRPELGCRVWG